MPFIASVSCAQRDYSRAFTCAWIFTALMLVGSCRKEPPSETVRPLGSAGIDNSQSGSGAGNASNAGSSGNHGASGNSAGGGANAGTTAGDENSGSGGNSGDGDGDGDSGAGGNSGTSAGSEAGDGDGGGDGDADPDGGVALPTPPFTKVGLLEASAACAMQHYEDFLTRAQTLDDAADAYADDQNATTLEAARDAWRSANASWQRAEAFRFGPACADAMTGGQSLRDLIYSFPYSNRCDADAAVVDQTYVGSAFTSLAINTRGLATIEYLLFRGNTGNACSPGSVINVGGQWAALGADTITARRADYAARAANDVRMQAQTLVTAWAASDGNFEAKLVTAGNGSSVFAGQQDAFNAINEALYYIEIETKDLKLGWPLGFSMSCLNAPDTCPNNVESLYARVSTDNLRQNLIGIRRLFEGCGAGYSGLGFDDWLLDHGNDDVAHDMIAALEGSQAAIDALSPPLEDAIVSDPSKVAVIHAAVKVFTDLLKVEFITLLNLEPPAGVEGDND